MVDYSFLILDLISIKRRVIGWSFYEYSHLILHFLPLINIQNLRTLVIQLHKTSRPFKISTIIVTVAYAWLFIPPHVVLCFKTHTYMYLNYETNSNQGKKR